MLTREDVARMSKAGEPPQAMLYSMHPYPPYSPFYSCAWRQGFHPYYGWSMNPWGFC